MGLGLGLELENKERTKEIKGTTKTLMAILDIYQRWMEMLTVLFLIHISVTHSIVCVSFETLSANCERIKAIGTKL